MRRLAATLTLATVWDLLSTWAVRFTADRDYKAVGFAVVLTIFWWAGVNLVNKSPVRMAVFLAGAALGTLIGISWP